MLVLSQKLIAAIGTGVVCTKILRAFGKKDLADIVKLVSYCVVGGISIEIISYLLKNSIIFNFGRKTTSLFEEYQQFQEFKDFKSFKEKFNELESFENKMNNL